MIEIDKDYCEELNLDYYVEATDANNQLKHTIEELGYVPYRIYKSVVTDFLGGSQYIPQYIAQLHFNANSVIGIVTLNLLASTVYDSLKEIRKVVLKHKPKPSAGRPKILVEVHGTTDRPDDTKFWQTLRVEFFADADNPEAQIMQTLQTASIQESVSTSKAEMQKMIQGYEAERARRKSVYPRRAAILHGTDGNPDENWLPRQKIWLEFMGYDVWIPQLPDCHTPDRTVYNDFLLSSGWDFTNNTVIGHSSGAVEILNLLMDPRCPKIKLGILVSAWAGGDPKGWKDTGQFKNLFPAEGFDFETIKAKANQLEFVHAVDDPYCPLEQAEYLAEQTGANLTVLQKGGHLSVHDIPELLPLLQKGL